MRLPNASHEQHPWVIADVAPDFKLLDVWGLPVEGDREDFGAFLQTMAAMDPVGSRLSLSHALFWVRLRLGSLFGWDDPTKKRSIPGRAEASLSARLPGHLRATADTPLLGGATRRVGGGFRPLYRTDNEAAAEISNDTVHGVLHLGWVERGDGRHGAQLGIYVKSRGAFGDIYLKFIQPFRHYIVYPALERRLGRAWDEARAESRRERP